VPFCLFCQEIIELRSYKTEKNRMTTILFLFLATAFLAYSNGANDNFKGVATLFGSDTTDYRKALGWATITTFLGSVSSVFFAQALIRHFSGKGLVPDFVVGAPEFATAVALGAGLTVILATITGLPISTTHSITGALVGAGFGAVGMQVNFSVLGTKFFAPLLFSPLIAVILGSLFYIIFRYFRIRMGVTKEMCVCVGESVQVVSLLPSSKSAGTLALRGSLSPEISIDTTENCTTRYTGNVAGIPVQKLLDFLHFLSAGVVSFARGLNDTPKIVALILVLEAFDVQLGMAVVGVAMAVGGLLNARKVAQTISKKITPLNHGQGFTANLVTGLLVIFASRFGMPVSTTHVSVGSIFGLGLVTHNGDRSVISKILLSWLLTLPIATLASGCFYLVLV
jgi:PiT family inorganic phosphate transporter